MVTDAVTGYTLMSDVNEFLREIQRTWDTFNTG